MLVGVILKNTNILWCFRLQNFLGSDCIFINEALAEAEMKLTDL